MPVKPIREQLEELKIVGTTQELIMDVVENFLLPEPIGTTKTRSFLLCGEEKYIAYTWDGDIPDNIIKMYKNYDKYIVILIGVKAQHYLGSRSNVVMACSHLAPNEFEF